MAKTFNYVVIEELLSQGYMRDESLWKFFVKRVGITLKDKAKKTFYQDHKIEAKMTYP